MKLNKKGFMMAEVVVVSSVVLIILTTLYISYNKIVSLYETRLMYEDSNLLYSLAYYRDSLVETYDEEHGDRLSKACYDLYYEQGSNNHYDILLNRVEYLPKVFNEDIVYLIHNNYEQKIDAEKFLNHNGHLNNTLVEYINYLSTSVDFSDADYIMLLERPYKDSTYKYAYLVLDNKKSYQQSWYDF